MSYATYICQLGCMGECRHHHPCLVFDFDAEHPHPRKHIAEDPATGEFHEWTGKGTGKCTVSNPGPTRRSRHHEPTALSNLAM